jgi:very-short-patch-repair endonuclease
VLIARLDLCRPDLGFFVELDGQHHEGQPVYDASRETAVVAATGWLPGRFTWTEVVHYPESTKRRLAGVVAQARARVRAESDVTGHR